MDSTAATTIANQVLKVQPVIKRLESINWEQHPANPKASNYVVGNFDE